MLRILPTFLQVPFGVHSSAKRFLDAEIPFVQWKVRMTPEACEMVCCRNSRQHGPQEQMLIRSQFFLPQKHTQVFSEEGDSIAI